jgi:DNA replication protein DnaC
VVDNTESTTENSDLGFGVTEEELLGMRLDRARIPKLYREASWDTFMWDRIYEMPTADIREKLIERLGILRNWRGDVDQSSIAFLTGRPGTGKTFLAVATLRRYIESGRRGALFITVSEWLQAMKDSFATGMTAGIMNQAKVANLLAFDDVGSEMATDWVRDAVYQVINHRLNEMKPTIVTSNLRPSEIAESYHTRLASRLASGLVIDLSPLPDMRIKK